MLELSGTRSLHIMILYKMVVVGHTAPIAEAHKWFDVDEFARGLGLGSLLHVLDLLWRASVPMQVCSSGVRIRHQEM